MRRVPTSPRASLEEVIARAEAARAAGRPRDAIRAYEAWIASHETPARCVALFNLGVLRADLGDLEGASLAYREALVVNPAFHQARINAGLIAERQNQDADAARHWLGVAEAVAAGDADARPLATIALNHLGRLQEARRQYEAAESALTHSLTLDPKQPDAIQHWVHLRQKQCRWPVFEPPPGLTVNALMGATSPLAMLALFDDPALQWLAALSFVTRKYAARETPLPPVETPPGERLRIGYLSGDLCTHAVGLLVAEMFEAHDRSRVHVTAFDFSPEDGTAHRARLKRAVDEMVSIHALSDRAAAEAIRARHIDVLIDMHGLSSGARPGVLALKPAPLQGAYLGFIGTTAFPWLDFVVTDRFTTPDAVTPYLTERALYIDGSMIPLCHDPVGPPRVTRASMGLPADAVVLASFNNIYKITPGMFACWLRILQRCGRAVLWLLDDNPWATAALRGHAERAGIDPSRLIFAGRSTHAEYRERLTLADLYLDTYPYNAGSTARDVLDALVPMVTVAGRTPVSRMAGGLLHAAGFDELIATSVDGYETLAVTLAGDSERRAAIVAEMRRRAPGWRTAPARLVRSLEDQLVAWVRSRGLRGPAPSTVPH